MSWASEHPLGFKIFLDRYALKGRRENAKVGDTVVVLMDSETERREIGTLTNRNGQQVSVRLLESDEDVIFPLEAIDLPLETSPEQMMARVAAGIAAVEPDDERRVYWANKFRELLADWQFVPGGRILTAAGTDQKLSMFNCFVVPSPKDSRGGIIETLSQMTEIMSRGGGVGINISTLRSRHAYVKGVNGRSSGVVSWGSLYSFVTGLIEQGGCFAPNERIATDRGLIPATELADRIDAGEVFHAHTHKGLRQITARFRNGVKPVYEVTTKRGYKVRVTEDHKIAVLMDGKITTMPLKYLQEGDEILLLLGRGVQTNYLTMKPVDYQRSIMSTTLNDNVRIPTILDEDTAYLLGYMHGDGYVHIGKKVTWQAPKAIKMATADAYPEIRERIVETVRRTFNVEPTIENGDGACKNVTMYSRLIIEWLNTNGLLKAKAEDIRVPEAIFRSPSSVQAAFIAGYFDADGCFRGRKGGYGIDSISREMLEDVQQILALNGIVSRISATDRSEHGWQTIYRLTITGGTFKKRFAAFVPTAKVSDANGKRDMYITYPASVWTSLGARAKYRQRIYDGVSERVSFGQLEKINARLLADGQLNTAEQLAQTLNTVPDQIVAIQPLGDSDVFDFEVDDVHLLSGNGVYTSNSRRGALMLILNDWHPDVLDFINSKRKAGQITNANISVGLSDKFMAAVKTDGDWELMFPDTNTPDYDTVWDGDLEKWIADGRPVVTYKTVKAREIWDALVESAWASAEPGMWFRDRANHYWNGLYYNKLVATNPCVTGDTRIYTDKGLVSAQTLYEQQRDIEVAIDGRFGQAVTSAPATRIFKTGTKPVYRVQTREGYYVRATGDHRVMTERGWVEVQDLAQGDQLRVLNHKGGFGVEGSLEMGRVLGWLIGDGTIKEEQAVLSFFGEEKQVLAPMFAQYVNDIAEPMTVGRRGSYPVGVVQIQGRDEARVQSSRLRSVVEGYGLVEKKHRVPEVVFQGSEDMQRGFLQALFTADGSFQASYKSTSIRLAANDLELLEGVQQLLLNFGVASRIYRNRRVAGYRMMPDTNRELKQYWCEAQHELAISKRNMDVFSADIGFLMPYKQEALASHVQSGKRGTYSESFVARVESVTADGIEDVFDLTEPLTHSFVGNGIVVHNCGEQSLSPWSVCNLGALNLAKFHDEKLGDVAWARLAEATRVATRFLDNVIDATPYFYPENEDKQKSERRIGLGIMGLAELLIKLGVRYGSEESLQWVERIFAFITTNAYWMSTEIAAEKGSFSKYNAEGLLDSPFIQRLPFKLQDAIRTQGLRNVTLITVAPTGSTGTMVNTSTGIEPFFSWEYYRKGRLGLHKEHVAIARDYLAAHPELNDQADALPNYFVTAMQLTPEEHVRVQAVAQKWVDSSISKTANLPNDYTVEQVGDLYQLMYNLGCKGGTVYRDGSRSEQVLILDKQPAAPVTVSSSSATTVTLTLSEMAIPTPFTVEDRPTGALNGRTIAQASPWGTLFVTLNLRDDYPFEVFITVGKAGSDLEADAQALGRTISLFLRALPAHQRWDALANLAGQLRHIGGERASGFGIHRTTSFPDAVGVALEKLCAPTETVVGDVYAKIAAPELIFTTGTDNAYPNTVTYSGTYASGGFVGTPLMTFCPSCKQRTLVHQGGCKNCIACGYSEC